MDEELGTKAPVTRLRRRLSVEQSEESKSPAPSTPTKKRGGRTAKPQLELIAETPEKTPKNRTTRKSMVKDAIDEEKPLTPSRRSARIRSNTSIISDTPQNFESPRAKRATRRTSQIGSDNEAPTQTTTPAKTRKNRKDSITSVEKPGDTTLITDVISEEPEIEPSKLSNASENFKEKAISPNSPRKSPRLQAKKGHSSDYPGNETSVNNISEKDDVLSIDKINTDESKEIVLTKTPTSGKKKEIQDKSEGISKNVDISLTSRDLIEKTEKNAPFNSSNICNKSLSSLIEKNNNKRTRTKSWTTLSLSPSCGSDFFSDNESLKKKVRSKLSVNDIGRKTGSGDSILNNSLNNSLNNDTDKKLNSSSKRKKKDSFNNSKDQFQNVYVHSNNLEEFEKTKLPSDSKNEKEENLDQNISKMQKLFDISPEVIKSKVYIEDSDSNSETAPKEQLSEDQCVPEVPQPFNNLTNSQQKETNVNLPEITVNDIKNQSCEPMDIDETMPENVVLNDSSDNSKNGTEIEDLKQSACRSEISISKKKSSNSISVNDTVVNESYTVDSKELKVNSSLSDRKSLNNSSTSNKTVKSVTEGVDAVDSISKKNLSKRKNSMSKSVTEEINTTGDQNKSTLVLSQLKEDGDVSSAPPDEKNSLNINDVAKDEEIVKTVSTTNYLTSTPLQDKIGSQVLKKRVPVNVSDINTKQNDSSADNGSIKSQSADEDNSDEESEDESKSQKLFIEEAEEASDDYESGDSRDEEERDYEKENEIIDKGETITSDDEISNDTDYEKDSFIVSSDEEDKELLDGSGDDLAMSDNELSMSAKSKRKYNERKVKEQKEASREMFKARHSLDSTKKRGGKTDSMKLDSKLLDSDDHSDDEIKTKLKSKKTNRLRLNSSQESCSGLSETENSLQTKKKKSKTLSESVTNSDADNSMRIKKKKVKRLSESVLETTYDEKEITVTGEYITERDPLEKVKEEPDTPQKSLIEHHIELDENMSVIKSNESKDPLQTTFARDNEDDDSDLSSNPDITSDYQNLLSTLNNINDKKYKNLSLNIDNKSKIQSKEPIVEQLNLTLTKKKKGTKSSENEKRTQDFSDSNDESSSDAIDMKLLFTEDSNDSDKQDGGLKIQGEENFIPLKRTEAKTNLHDTVVKTTNANELSTSSKKGKNGNVSISGKVNETGNKSLNVSLKKKQKNTSISIDNSDTGNEAVSNVANDSLNSSIKKNEKQNNPVSEIKADIESESLNETKRSLETRTKKNKKNSISIETESAQTEEKPMKINNESGSKKKKKNNSINKDDKDGGAKLELSFNTSGRKSKNSSISETLNVSSQDTSVALNNKNKYNSSKSISIDDDDDDDEMPIEIPFKSDKVQQDQSTEANSEVVKIGKKIKNNKANISSSIQEVLEVAATLYAPTNSSATADQNDLQQTSTLTPESGKKKKRKNKHSKDISNGAQSAEANQNHEDVRKRKLAAISSVESTEDNNSLNCTNSSQKGNKKKKQKTSDEATDVAPSTNKNRKRKKRDEDFEVIAPKVMKETNSNKAQVPRLPLDIIKKLDEKPSKEVLEQKKARIVSTSEFIVETATAKIRKNKPSHYLEDSIYLNESAPEKTIKTGKVKKPKVLPFVPTATTSGFGFTTKFQISVIPTETKFVAKTTDANFKNDYLQKKVKKFGTYELFKTQRKVKLSKF